MLCAASARACHCHDPLLTPLSWSVHRSLVRRHSHNQVSPQTLFKPASDQETTPPATGPATPGHPAGPVRMIAASCDHAGAGVTTCVPPPPDSARPDSARPVGFKTGRRRSIDTASAEDREDAFLLFNCMLQASESTTASPTNSSDDGSDGSDGNSPGPNRRSSPPPPAAAVATADAAQARGWTDAVAAAKGKSEDQGCPRGGEGDVAQLHSPSKRAKTTVSGFSAFEGGRTLFNKTRAFEDAAAAMATAPAGKIGKIGKTPSIRHICVSLSGAETSPEKMSMADRAAAVSASDKADELEPVKPPGVSQDQWSKKVNKMKGNRLAAKRCRERKKQYISYLEKRIAFLEESNTELQSTLHGYGAQTRPPPPPRPCVP